jgi:uncharacterized membrane protein (Fun14 family)
MKKYLIVIVINGLLLLGGVFLSFNNERLDIRSLEQACYMPIIEAIQFDDKTDETVMNEHGICFEEGLVDEGFIDSIRAIEVDDSTTIKLDSKDNILTINTVIKYSEGETLERIVPKYLGHHIPYDVIVFLAVILLNTVVYLFDRDYDKVYSFNTVLNTAGTGLIIGYLLTYQFGFNVPIYYYLSGIYMLVLIIHFYSMVYTKEVNYHLKIDELQAEKLHEGLLKRHIDLKVYKRVNFSGQYISIKIKRDQIEGFRKLMDELFDDNKRLYFWINLILIGVINVVALSYLIHYFTRPF